MDPQRGWRTHDFPLNAGDNWQLDELIDYDGAFTYDAGSLGGTGGDTFAGTLPFQAPPTSPPRPSTPASAASSPTRCTPSRPTARP